MIKIPLITEDDYHQPKQIIAEPFSWLNLLQNVQIVHHQQQLK